jgi:hypothetical protein
MAISGRSRNTVRYPARPTPSKPVAPNPRVATMGSRSTARSSARTHRPTTTRIASMPPKRADQPMETKSGTTNTVISASQVHSDTTNWRAMKCFACWR